MEVILTHQNADFDAVASMLGAHKLYPQAVPVLPPTLHGTVREFITLYKNGLPFVAWNDFRPQEPVTRLILTDTQTYPSPRWLDDDTDIPTLIIEHHEQERPMKPHETWQGELIGAATTLTVEQIRAEDIHLDSLEATLMALGIYVDTGMLTYGKTSPRDLQAAAWLLEHGAVLDTVRRFSSHPLSSQQQTLFEQLLDQTDTRRIQGYEITVCRGQHDENMRGLNSVTERLRDILDADALFVVVAFPDYVQMVSRSAVDAVHVGDVAQHLGGGGHPRAAAAAIQKANLDDVLQSLGFNSVDRVKLAARLEKTTGDHRTLFSRGNAGPLTERDVSDIPLEASDLLVLDGLEPAAQRVLAMRAYGAEVIRTSPEETIEDARRTAEAMAATGGYRVRVSGDGIAGLSTAVALADHPNVAGFKAASAASIASKALLADFTKRAVETVLLTLVLRRLSCVSRSFCVSLFTMVRLPVSSFDILSMRLPNSP